MQATRAPPLPHPLYIGPKHRLSHRSFTPPRVDLPELLECENGNSPRRMLPELLLDRFQLYWLTIYEFLHGCQNRQNVCQARLTGTGNFLTAATFRLVLQSLMPCFRTEDSGDMRLR